MTQVVNDRIAQRAKEQADARLRAEGAEAARAWLSAGPVKVGARFRPRRVDREALIGMGTYVK
jgi:hypothetical protein